MDLALTPGPFSFARRRRPREGRGDQCRVCAKRSYPLPLPAPSPHPQALALPFALPYPERCRRASPVPCRGPSSAACRHAIPRVRNRPRRASSLPRRRCASRSIRIPPRIPPLWPNLPASFAIPARVVAPPRFLQILRAPIPLFSPLLVPFPRRPLTFFVGPATVCHATLPLPLHLRWSVHPRRRLTICPAPLPMSPAQRPPDPRLPDLLLQEPPYVRPSVAPPHVAIGRVLLRSCCPPSRQVRPRHLDGRGPLWLVCIW